MTTVSRYNDKQEIGDLLIRVNQNFNPLKLNQVYLNVWLKFKVQDDLKGLRSLISQDGSKIDLKTLQSTILRAEHEIKEKTDHLINQINSQVKTLPTVEEQDSQSPNYATLENLLDLAKKEKKEKSSKSAQSRSTSNVDIRPSSK